ncbi:MAG: phosphatidylinositol-4- kinase [Phylliscum demangeonii]|nr:MAG: phosphatidylinositol-4- kinase [Phylliscum demangeonii]
MVTTLPFRREEEVLDVLEARYDAVKTSAEKARLANASTIEALAEIASQQMRHLDDGADYVRLSSMWRERLGLGVKACALTVFLICTLCTQQAAMIELLVTWLDETMSDPIQMADDHLALTLAAKSLSSVLQLLSEDAVISALYALGVVLSTGNGGKKEGPGTTPSDVGSDGSLVIPVDELSRLGSATTSSAGSQVDTSIRYHHVIEAIAVIAASCNDRKIAALAQSLLLQKFRKISYAVDATILIESAALASVGGSVDFRSLLRLYERIAHDSVISGNRELLDAVSLAP